MKPSFKLGPQQRLQTRLVITPGMHQSLDILQFGASQLADYLERVVADNPFLEVRRPHLDYDDFPPIADTQQESLTDHLLAQLRVSDEDGATRKVAAQLVLMLNERGYFTDSVDALRHALSVTAPQLTGALHLVQSLEPAGVGAFDLTDCLLLQARSIGRFDQTGLAILEQQELAALADQSQWPQLAARLACDVTALATALEAIRTLDPNPAGRFAGNDTIQYVVPDLVVERTPAGLQLLDSQRGQVRVRFDEATYNQLRGEADPAAMQYLRVQRSQYRTLSRALNRRQVTLMQIGQQIVQVQAAFLNDAAAQLAPLTMSACASAIGVSVATVSRAIKDKYLRVGGRVIALRECFRVPVAKSGVTAGQIGELLQAVIKREDAEEPLSDIELVQRLAAKHVEVSRRTVAKIRKQLGIGNRYERTAGKP